MMVTPDPKWQLIRESEWIRVYLLGDKRHLVESKFQTDGLQISAQSLRMKWSSLSPADQHEFALAFISKPVFTEEDQKVLDFLMFVRDDCVGSMVAVRLPEYSDRERALLFLLEKVNADVWGVANHYQALERMRDPRAIPLLRQKYDQYVQTLTPISGRTLRELGAYISCCSALRRLTGLQEYDNALRELLSHPEESVQHRAELELSER